MCNTVGWHLLRVILMLGYVPSASMTPAIRPNSYIIGMRIHGDLRRGDIVIFRRNERNLVKRIAAVSGDVVYVHGSTIRVNCALADAEQMIEVPDGYFYMLGDNVDESFDSRHWEEPFVSEWDVLAKLFIR